MKAGNGAGACSQAALHIDQSDIVSPRCKALGMAILPIACRNARPVYPTPEFIVASFNIHKAVGADRRRDPAPIGAVIAEIGADILAFQEADLRIASDQLPIKARRRLTPSVVVSVK
jgi:hypothetical protein